MKTTELDSYFARIGYEGPHSADIDVLKRLHFLHPKSIPFENLNPYLGIPVKLDAESIHKKLVYQGRGGYCFEQNLLFKSVLEELGFRVKGLGARILWNAPENAVTLRGHMLLLIESDKNRYIADVGFGGFTLTAPLLLEPDLVQQTPHESYRLVQPENGYYVLQTSVQNEWKPIYRFDLREQYLADYDVTNWYLSNHPESHFVTGLIAARPSTGKRYALRNNKFSIHTLKKKSEKQILDSVEELKIVLRKQFLITLPDIPDRDEKLRKLIDSNR